MTSENDRSKATAIGILAVVCGAIAAATVAVDAQGKIGGAFARELTIYGPAQASLTVLLVSAGLMMLVTRARSVVAALLGVTGLWASQLGGVGLVGRRRWPHWAGGTEIFTERDLVRTMATAMAIACAVTAVACLIALVRRRHLRWNGVDLSVAVACPAALVVAVAVPRLVVGAWDDERELAAWALMYSLPFAVALVVSAFMGRVAALAVAAAVALSAGVATVGQPFVASGDRGEAMLLVIFAAAAVAASRALLSGTRTTLGASAPDL